MTTPLRQPVDALRRQWSDAPPADLATIREALRLVLDRLNQGRDDTTCNDVDSTLSAARRILEGVQIPGGPCGLVRFADVLRFRDAAWLLAMLAGNYKDDVPSLADTAMCGAAAIDGLGQLALGVQE